MAVNAEKNQQYNQQQNDGQQTPATGGGAPQGSSAAPQQAGRTANFSSGTQTGSTGSGRFTNLSKYINANQGAGDRMAQGIGQKINTQNEASNKEAQTSASAVREGIQSAQNKIATGNQYKDQLNDQNFNAQDFASDQNRLQDFTQYRTGQAVDANALNQQNQQAQTNYLNLQNQIQNQLNQTGTDTGRYQLLKSAYGGGNVYQNPYSTGQQRLDQLFLQSGGNNAINNLQNNLRTQNVQAGNQVGQLSGDVANTISTVGTQSADLAKNLQDKTNQLTGDYVSGVEGTADEVNKARAAEQKYIQDQYANLNSGKAIDQRFADMMGLSQGQNFYNCLTGQNANNFFEFSPTNLSGFGQLANQQQEDYYKALSSLAGSDLAYDLDGDPAAAAKFLSGSFDDERTANDALTQDLSGRNASATGGNRLASANANLAYSNLMNELSKNTGLNYSGITGGNSNQAIAEYLANGQLQNNPQSALNAETRALLDSMRGQIQGNVTANNATHYVDETGRGAVGNAQQNALLQALQQLQDVNYFNRVNINPSKV